MPTTPDHTMIPLTGGAMKGDRSKRSHKQQQQVLKLMSQNTVKGAAMEDLNELSDVSDPMSINDGTFEDGNNSLNEEEYNNENTNQFSNNDSKLEDNDDNNNNNN